MQACIMPPHQSDLEEDTKRKGNGWLKDGAGIQACNCTKDQKQKKKLILNDCM